MANRSIEHGTVILGLVIGLTSIGCPDRTTTNPRHSGAAATPVTFKLVNRTAGPLFFDFQYRQFTLARRQRSRWVDLQLDTFCRRRVTPPS